MSEWPYRGDSAIARARRVAHAYRAALVDNAPAAAEQLDARMRSFGQHWVVPVAFNLDPHQWISAAQAAELACVELDAIRQMRKRGVINGRRRDGRWEYTVREIENSFVRARGRNRDVTDTVPSSGSTMPAEGMP